MRPGNLLSRLGHGDRTAALLVAFVAVGLLASTCGPGGRGDELAAGTGGPMVAPDALAPDAPAAVRQRAFEQADANGDGTIGPDELDVFFAALARAPVEADQAATTVPDFVGPTEVLPPVDTDDPRLFAVGDSVLEASSPTLAHMLPSWDLAADARVGRRVPEGAAVIEERRPDIGDVAVIVLGHNYARGEGFAAQLNRIMRDLWSLDRVVWVTVAEFDAGPMEANAVIRAAPERWPNVVVADWAELAAANPGYLQADGVHLTASGVLALADLMARGVGPGPIPGVPGIVAVDVPLGPSTPTGPGPSPPTPTPEGPGGPPGPAPTSTTTRPSTSSTTTRPVATTTSPPTLPPVTTSPVTTAPVTTAPVTTAPVSGEPPTTGGPRSVDHPRSR